MNAERQSWARTWRTERQHRSNERRRRLDEQLAKLELRAKLAKEESDIIRAEIQAGREGLEALRKARATLKASRRSVIVSLLAPRGRVDEYVGDFQQDLHALIRAHGERTAIWIYRGRVALFVLDMLPGVCIRLLTIWKTAR
jgi:hypothetical protein